MFVNLLSGPLDRVVINKTGLKGRYDVNLRYMPGSGQVAYQNGEPTQPADDSAASIFTALQEQLGLRLEPGRGPVDVLRVDHVERPQ